MIHNVSGYLCWLSVVCVGLTKGESSSFHAAPAQSSWIIRLWGDMCVPKASSLWEYTITHTKIQPYLNIKASRAFRGWDVNHWSRWPSWPQWHLPFLNLWPLIRAGVSLNPIIVYCANQQEMDLWFGLLKENIEANGGTAIAPENFTRVKVSTALYFGFVRYGCWPARVEHSFMFKHALRMVRFNPQWISRNSYGLHHGDKTGCVKACIFMSQVGQCWLSQRAAHRERPWPHHTASIRLAVTSGLKCWLHTHRWEMADETLRPRRVITKENHNNRWCGF